MLQVQGQAVKNRPEAPTQLQAWFAESTTKVDKIHHRLRMMIHLQRQQLYRLTGRPLEEDSLDETKDQVGYIRHSPAAEAMVTTMNCLDGLGADLEKLEGLLEHAYSMV